MKPYFEYMGDFLLSALLILSIMLVFIGIGVILIYIAIQSGIYMALPVILIAVWFFGTLKYIIEE